MCSSYPGLDVHLVDLKHPLVDFDGKFDIIFCYGLLYHLGNPAKATEFMSKACLTTLIMETGVSSGEKEVLNP